MFGDQLKGTTLNWMAGIKENEKARNKEVTYELLVKEFKSRYCNMQDINRHAYEKLMRGEISMRNLEYKDPHRYLAAFQDVARAAGTHSGDHIGIRRKYLEGLDTETAKMVQWKGETGMRT